MTIIALLDARLPAPIAEADQSITVAPADPATAAQLGCAAGDPLLRIDRLYSDTAGRPVELAISHFLPELYCTGPGCGGIDMRDAVICELVRTPVGRYGGCLRGRAGAGAGREPPGGTGVRAGSAGASNG